MAAPKPTKKSDYKKKVDKWEIIEFENPARKDQFKLKHWAKVLEKDEVYPFAKIDFKVQIIKYTDEEYEKLLKDLTPGWTREDTDHLWYLAE